MGSNPGKRGIKWPTELDMPLNKTQTQNRGKRAASSPSPRCSSYWKASVWVTFDYDRPNITQFFVYSKLQANTTIRKARKVLYFSSDDHRSVKLGEARYVLEDFYILVVSLAIPSRYLSHFKTKFHIAVFTTA